MAPKDFTTTILVDQTPKQVFNAVNNVRGWWSENIDGGTEKQNDVFDYHYEDAHTAKIKLEEVVPDKRVVWHMLKNYFKFTKDTSELTGSRVIFDISTKGGQTQLTFTHQGLVPACECYDICQQAWTHYVQESLHDLITEGKGEPNPKEGGFNAELTEKWESQQ